MHYEFDGWWSFSFSQPGRAGLFSSFQHTNHGPPTNTLTGQNSAVLITVSKVSVYVCRVGCETSRRRGSDLDVLRTLEWALSLIIMIHYQHHHLAYGSHIAIQSIISIIGRAGRAEGDCERPSQSCDEARQKMRNWRILPWHLGNVATRRPSPAPDTAWHNTR